MLATHIPEDFSGHAADFGAGWGYLSVMLGGRAPNAKGIDLFEAHYEALEAARNRVVEPILPRVVGTREDHRVVLPGDPDY